MIQTKLFAGIDLGGTNIKSGLVSRDGDIQLEKNVPSETEGGVHHVLDRMAACVKDTMRELGEGITVKGVGVGVAGLVEYEKGLLHEAPNLPGWSKVPVKAELEKRLKMDVFVDNDANLAALGEYAFGAGQGITEMLMVTLGTGVGGGLILRGEIYHGAIGAAGEFGHITVQLDGPVCGCGRRGCVEAFVGTQGILRSVQEKLDSGRKSLLEEIDPGQRTPKDVSRAARNDDAVAIEVLAEVGTYLGAGMGNVANLLNIQRVVVGGGVAKAGDFILKPARKGLQRVALETSAKSIEVVPAMLGTKAGLVGAARMAMDN
ncbi:ROK family protein [bacterium]